MAWFFIDSGITDGRYIITGEDARHIEKSLRMKCSEELTLVSPDKTEYSCVIESFLPEGVEVRVVSQELSESEPSVEVTLYQSLTKGDKMELVVQKSVELGVTRIVPVITSRCISRPDKKTIAKKTERWQKIALSASQQSHRGIVPRVDECMSLEEALNDTEQNDLSLIFYEGGGESLRTLLGGFDKGKIGIFIGCEGGFDISEVDRANARNVNSATLGRRILRTETAPLASLSAIMCLTGNMDI